MDDRQVLEAYISALREERERFLLERAEKRVRTGGKPREETEGYLRSPAFRNEVYRLQRRDKACQALRRGELREEDRWEYEQLLPLLREELAQGRSISLPFLRGVLRGKKSLAQAREAAALVEEKKPEQWFRGRTDYFARQADQQVSSWLREVDCTPFLRQDQHVEAVLPYLMKTVFRRGVPYDMMNDAFASHPFTDRMLEDLYREYPVLLGCSRLSLPSGESIGAALRTQARRAKYAVFQQVGRQFPAGRISRLLTKSPSVQQLQRRAEEALEKERSIRSALLEAVPAHYRDLFPLARAMKRHFILHLGPTNSGKTYEGVQRLRGALRGIYLGPLRLLAAEQFETLNLLDTPCSLVTGEEQIRVPGSLVQSSTVEMADLKARYDVAVIDECQLMADRDRGGAWTAAILGLCADEIHVCASPDAEDLLIRMIRDCGDSFAVARHERMTPLLVEKEGFQFPSSVRPGDALIVFSKARVHAVAADLRSRGWRVSLVYGALPPDVRRDQARRFQQGETEVVVSTDAIAMGMNLPIRRVVFLESEKYDGEFTRTLTDPEIRQIAGRAGRYGLYDVGYVNAYGFKGLVSQAMNSSAPPLTEAVIRFPESLLGLPLPLTKTIHQWLSMQDQGCFSKASTVRMEKLAMMMETKTSDKSLLYRFICIPFDETDPDLMERWKALYQAERAGEHQEVRPLLPPLVDPEGCTIQMLDGLEADYRTCDLYYNYVRLFLEEPEELLQEIQRIKDLISKGIIHILSTQKLQPKTCRSCKRRLPWNWPYSLCDSCFRVHQPRRRT